MPEPCFQAQTAIASPPAASRLTYTVPQLCAALQVSKVTLWRLEQRRLLVPVPHLRHKRYFAEAVQRFLNGAAAGVPDYRRSAGSNLD
jgi:hypothetical protein